MGARRMGDHELAQFKDREIKSAATELRELCERMDKDKSATLTMDEILQGYDENQEFQDLLKVMDVKKADMRAVFKMMDEDQSGDVDYNEFVGQLYMMKTQEDHTLLIFIKFYINQIYLKLGLDNEELMHSEVGGTSRPKCLTGKVAST